jgi:tRNA guanosine-2'-O-methyltransferase
MDDAILYLSDELKLKAFELNYAKLEASTTPLNLDALRLCVRLLPDSVSEPHEKLRDLLLRRLRDERHDPEFYQIAEACTSNAAFAVVLFTTIHQDLAATAEPLHPCPTKPDALTSVLSEDYMHPTATLLRFLKCSFWLPPNSLHVLEPSLFRTLSAFVGTEGLTEAALDALSALLSLLSRRRHEPIYVANPGTEVPWLEVDSASGRFVLCQPIIDEWLWTAFKTLHPAHFETKSSNLYKVWFQWISQAVTDGLDPAGVYEDLYWARVRTGLLTGFADQRKYCLGIVRASLLAAQRDISTDTMRMQVSRRDVYIKAYDRYFSLYETIVLDRYANQIEACLPELSALFGPQSVVTASMATTLLSSGLDPQVQEGIRKIVGNWYFGFMSGSQSPLSKDFESLAEHTTFLVRGFLPWATQGSLFTSTMKATRMKTECKHGAALVTLITRFITSKYSHEGYRDELLVRILGFVLDAGGKMFQMSTLYLLEGLIRGYDEGAEHGEFSTASVCFLSEALNEFATQFLATMRRTHPLTLRTRAALTHLRTNPAVAASNRGHPPSIENARASGDCWRLVQGLLQATL